MTSLNSRVANVPPQGQATGETATTAEAADAPLQGPQRFGKSSLLVGLATLSLAGAGALLSLGQRGQAEDTSSENGIVSPLPRVQNYEGPLKDFLTGQDASGQPTHTSAIGTPYNVSIPDLLADGKVVALDFWATWCINCPRVSTYLHNEAAKYPNVVVVSVTTEKVQDVAKWLTRTQGSSDVPQSIILTGATPVQEYFEKGQGERFAYPSVVILTPSEFAKGKFAFWTPADPHRDTLPGLGRLLKSAVDSEVHAVAAAPVHNTWYVPGSVVGSAGQYLSERSTARPDSVEKYSAKHLNNLLDAISKRGVVSEDDVAELRSFYRNSLPGLYDQKGGYVQWEGDGLARESWVARTAALFRDLKHPDSATPLGDDFIRVLEKDPSVDVRLEAIKALRLKIGEHRLVDTLSEEQRQGFLNAASVCLTPGEPTAVRLEVAKLLNNYAFRLVDQKRWSPAAGEVYLPTVNAAFEAESEPSVKFELFQAAYALNRGSLEFPPESASEYTRAFYEWGKEGASVREKYKPATGFTERLQALTDSQFSKPEGMRSLFNDIREHFLQNSGLDSLDLNGRLALGQLCIRLSSTALGDVALTPEAKKVAQQELARYLVAWSGRDFSLEATISEGLAAVGVDQLDGDTKTLLLSKLPTVQQPPHYPGQGYLVRFMIEQGTPVHEATVLESAARR